MEKESTPPCKMKQDIVGTVNQLQEDGYEGYFFQNIAGKAWYKILLDTVALLTGLQEV